MKNNNLLPRLILLLVSIIYAITVGLFFQKLFAPAYNTHGIFIVSSFAGLVVTFLLWRHFLIRQILKSDILKLLSCFLPLIVGLVIRYANFNTVFGINLGFSDNARIFIATGLALSLAMIYNFFISFSEIKLSKNQEKLLIIVCTAFFTLLFFAVAARMQYKFLTTAADIGIYDQKVWRFSQFLPTYNSILEKGVFADHFEPFLFVLGLFYKIFSNIYLLIFFESLFIAIGFVPVFLLSKEILKNNLSALLIGSGYLLSMGILYGVNFPVHPGSWIAACYGFMFYFGYKKKFIWYYLFMLIAMSMKESVFIHLIAIGFFVAIIYKEKIHGLVTIIMSVLYYVFVFKYVFPLATGDLIYPHSFYSTISGGTNEPADVLKNMILHPINTIKFAFSSSVKAETFWITLGSTGFITLFSWGALILVAPLFVERLLSDYAGLNTMYYHYGIPLSMITIVVAIFAINNIHKKYPGIKVSSMALYVFLCSFLIMSTSLTYHSPLVRLFRSENWALNTNEKETYNILKTVPKDVSVISQDPFVPHLSERKMIGLVGLNNIENFDYVILSKKDIFGAWPVGFDYINQIDSKLKNDNTYTIFAENDTIVVFKRK